MEDNDITIAKCAGEIDMSTADEVRSILLPVAGRVMRIAVDFSDVTYISSAGLRVLMLFSKSVRDQGGRAVLFGLQPLLREIFEISRFDKVLRVVSTRIEADAYLRGGTS